MFFILVNAYVDIKKVITEKARKVNQNIKVIAFALDNDEPIGMEKLFNSVEESMKNGNWIVIDNAHLVNSWSSDMLKLFYVSFGRIFHKLFC